MGMKYGLVMDCHRIFASIFKRYSLHFQSLNLAYPVHHVDTERDGTIYGFCISAHSLKNVIRELRDEV